MLNGLKQRFKPLLTFLYAVKNSLKNRLKILLLKRLIIITIPSTLFNHSTSLE